MQLQGVTLTLGTTNNTYIKDDTVTLTVEKEGTDIVTVTAKNGDTDVALNEVQEAAQDEAAAQATTEKAKTVYTFTMPDGDVTINVDQRTLRPMRSSRRKPPTAYVGDHQPRSRPGC